MPLLECSPNQTTISGQAVRAQIVGTGVKSVTNPNDHILYGDGGLILHPRPTTQEAQSSGAVQFHLLGECSYNKGGRVK